MRSAVLLLASCAGAASAQRATARELSLGALVTTAGRDFVGAALGFARRTGSQGRLALNLAGAPERGQARAGLRLEATVQFVLNPGARAGPAVYAAGGAAYLGARERRGAGYLVAWMGLESGGAWAPRGWFLELGAGGGVRAALGLRWRRWRR